MGKNDNKMKKDIGGYCNSQDRQNQSLFRESGFLCTSREH